MTKKWKPKTKHVIEVLEKMRGNKKRAAIELGINRMTLHRYIEKSPTVKAAYLDIKEGAIDDAELMLESRMQQSDTLLIFYLKTQGKGRGYVERVEQTGKDGEAVEYAVRWDDPDTD